MKQLITRVLGPEDRQLLEAIVKEYVEDEALCKHLKFTKEDKNIFVQTYVDVGIKGATLGYFNEETGEMIGCGIASLSSYHVDPDTYAKYGKASPQLQALMRFDEFMEKEAIDFTGGRNIMTLELGILKRKYRNLGLSLASKNETEVLARQLNCDAVAITLNVEYTVKPFIRIGFIPIKTIRYEDYRDPVTGEAIFAGLPPSHKSCTLLVKPLKNTLSNL